MRPISARRVLLTLLAVVGALVVAELAAQFIRFQLGHDYAKGFVPLFSVDSETNIPAWFSTILLFASSLLLGVIAATRHAEGGRFAGRWALLAACFFLMSADEAAAMHELLVDPLRELLALDGLFYFSWVVVGLVLVAIIGIYLLPLLKTLAGTWRKLFLLAAALYLTGALGLEMVSGAYVEVQGRGNVTYAMLALVEETLEMLGLSVFLYGLLRYIGAKTGEIRIPILAEEGPPGRGRE